VVTWRFPFDKTVFVLVAAFPLRKAAKEARHKFLRFFPGGFYDQKYIDWNGAISGRHTRPGDTY